MLEVFVSLYESKADFDVISASLGNDMDAFLETFVETSKQRWPDVPDHELRSIEIILAGFSLRRDRMEAISYRRNSTSPAFEAVRVDPWSIGYAADWSQKKPPPALDSVPAMLDACRHQVEHATKHHPGEAIGGNFVTLELRRGSARFERHLGAM